MVSVLVPAYNAEKTISRCLDSILRQTVSDMEIIIVNDGSKDNTLQILREYAQKDSRITLIDQPNGGVAAARNALLCNAVGDYILYVDADDWIEPDMLERMLGLMDDADIVFCGHDSAEKPEQVKRTDEAVSEIWDQDRQLLEFMKHKRMTGMLWNKLIRRGVTDGCRFNVQTGYGEDAEFLWQVLKKSRKMVVMNEVLYHHVMDDNSISHLTYSEKKYSAITMWENINAEVESDFPQYICYAKTSLVCAAVYGMFEARQSGYKNQKHIQNMRAIARKNIRSFIKADYISKKFKLYAIAVCMGY